MSPEPGAPGNATKWVWLRRVVALRWGGLLAAAVLVIAASSMSAISGLLRQLHVEGQPSGAVGDLWFNALAPEGPDGDRAEDVVCGWQAFSLNRTGGEVSTACTDHAAVRQAQSDDVQPQRPPANCTDDDSLSSCAWANGRNLARWFLIIDILLFCPAYVFLILAIWWRLKPTPSTSPQPEVGRGAPAALKEFRGSMFVAAAALLAFIFDELENLLTLGLVNDIWGERSRLLPSALSGSAPTIVWVLGLLKWAMLVAALIPLAFSALSWAVDHWKVVVRLVPVVALSAAPYFALQHPQGADAVRDWWSGQFIATTAATLLAGVAAAVISFTVASGPLEADEVHIKGNPGRGVLMLVGGLAVGVLGVLIARLHWLWWPGFGALLLLVGVTYVLSGPIELSTGKKSRTPSGDAASGSSSGDTTSGSSSGDATSGSAPATATDRDAGRVPRPEVVAAVVAAVPFVAVFAPAITASGGEAFFFRFASFGQWLDSHSGRRYVGTTLVVLVGLPLLVHTVLAVATRYGERHAPADDSSPGDARRWWKRPAVWVRVGAVIAAAGWVVVASNLDFQLGAAESFGAVAILVTFIIVVLVGLAVATRVADGIVAIQTLPKQPTETDQTHRDRWGPWTFPAAIRVAGFRRPPVVSGLIVWALLASVADSGTYHEARQTDRPAAVASVGQSLNNYVDAWVDRWNFKAQPDRPIPLVLVAGSGGGIRAAYWTTAVLDCIINRQRVGADPCAEPATTAVRDRRLRALFGLSGISGSSLGLVTFVAGSIENPATPAGRNGQPTPVLDDDERPVWRHKRWYQDVLDDDFLTPTLTRWMFNDVTNLWRRAALDPDCRGTSNGDCDGDRADALEQAWEQAWDGITEQNPMQAGFLSWQTHEGAHLPLLLLNSYSVEDGCRFNVSALRSNADRGPEQCRVLMNDLPVPATRGTAVLDATTDLVDFISCVPTADDPTGSANASGDVRVSTAALLSARFPFVTPSGKIVGCDGTSYLVDGGYRDTSAASTLTELWPSVQALLSRPQTASRVGEVAPIFLQIDNGYTQVDAARTDGRPNELLVPSQGQSRAMGGIANASTQSAERSFECFIRITTRAHPGSQAPLGWVLSPSSLRSLQAQLIASGTAIDRARRAIDVPTTPRDTGCNRYAGAHR